jgi:ABC-type molybdate transport system permease subunit
LALAPDLWSDFVAAMSTQVETSMGSAGQAIPLPLPLRLAGAALLTVWGAASNRRWVLPIVAILAIPFSWWNVLAIAVAAVPLTVPTATPTLARLVGRTDDHGRPEVSA